MNKNRIYVKLTFFCFLAIVSLVSTNAGPNFSENTSYIPSTYDENYLCNFTILWSNANTTYFENNFTGSLQNYTMSNDSNFYYYNMSSALGAGVYQYRFLANDSSGAWNMTDTLTFEISKASTTVTLYLNDTNGNIEFTYDGEINASASASNNEVDVKLYRNDTDVTAQMNAFQTLDAGIYEYVANCTHSENYSSATSSAFILKINKAESTIGLQINGSSSDKSLPDNSVARFQVTLTEPLNSGTIFLYTNLTGNEMQWSTATDASIDNYTDLSPYLPGKYKIEGNWSGNNNYLASTDIYILTITDTTAPTWDEMPKDQSVELGEKFIYDVNSSDDVEVTSYYVNDTTNFAVDGNGIITNNTELSLGVYSLQINASDAVGNNNSTSIVVTVQDTTAPTYDSLNEISDPTELGDSVTIELNIYDASGVGIDMVLLEAEGVNYTMVNTVGDTYQNNSWTPSTTGSLGYTIYMNDTSGNVNTTSDTITVEDTTAPTWDEVPQDVGLTYGEALYYDLNASDLSGIANYYINDTNNFSIDTDGILRNATMLSLGTYILQINATDNFGNNNSTTIIISVTDIFAPTWDQMPEDQTIELGDSFSYDVNATDAQNVIYLVNDSRFTVDGDGIITNATFLNVGVYPIQLNATDGTNINETTITITVEDTTAPTWDDPLSNPTIELGETFSYDVNATDLSDDITYTINDTTNFEINATNGMLTNNTELEVGVYAIEINATDSSNNVLSGTIIVTVEDTTNPMWPQIPQDTTAELGNDFTYDVSAIDLATLTYNVNDTNFSINSNGILTNNTVLQLGTYALMINVSDPSDNNNSTDFVVTAQDTMAPTWVQNPTEQTLDEGVALSYDLNATDVQSITYSINDTTNFAISAEGILSNNTTLAVGTYAVLVTVTDASNNDLTATIVITVEEIVEAEGEEVIAGKNTLTFTNEGISISFDSTATGRLTLETLTTNPTSKTIDNAAVFLNISTDIVSSALSGIKIVWTYQDGDISNLNEDDLSFFVWNGEDWEEIDTIVYADNNTLMATLPHLSLFAVAEADEEDNNFLVLLLVIAVALGIAAAMVFMMMAGTTKEKQAKNLEVKIEKKEDKKPEENTSSE